MLNFDGFTIYKHGMNGPYDLKNLTLSSENGTLIDSRDHAYTTTTYNYTDFQHLVALTGSYSDYGRDIDGDFIFDYLTIDVRVILVNPGYCVIKARLMDSFEQEIVWAENTTYLRENQPQIIQLNFDGPAIFDHGVDGLYYLRDVYIYHTGDPNQPDYANEAYTTNTYKWTWFGVPIDFTPPVTTLSIGLPQHINLLGEVYVTSDTLFTLEAIDTNGLSSGVALTGYRIYSMTHDTGWITDTPPLTFHICTCAADGTYCADYNSTDNAGNVEITNTAIVILDNTPPTTTLTIGEPKYISDSTYVTPDTQFTLEATDTASGIYSTAYESTMRHMTLSG